MYGRNLQTASRPDSISLEYGRRLKEEIRTLRSHQQDLESRLAASAECRSKFRLWAGCEFEKPTHTQFNVTFTPHYHGKACETFSVSFENKESVWSLNHHNLPCSINNLSERVKEAHMNTEEKLLTFLRNLQHEVNMFIWRREQINEAKSLISPSLTINSSVSTTFVHLTFKVDDAEGSNLCKAIAKLKYESDRYLPTLQCHFIGGSPDDQIALKEQLSVLQHLPLREAIMNAFPPSTEISSNLNTNIPPSIPPGRKRISSGPVKGNDPQKVPTGSEREQVTSPPSRLERAPPLQPPLMERRSLPYANNRGWDRGRGSGRGSRRSGRGSGGGYGRPGRESSREFGRESHRGFGRGRSFTR